MSAADLRRQLEAGEWDACQLAQELGPAALAELGPWLEHEDPLRRLLAVDCANEAGGEVWELLYARLADADAQVRMHATKGLLRRPPPAAQAARLLQLFDASRDPFVRNALPRVAAQAGQERGPWAKRLDDLDHASEGLLVALARQGDRAARSRFVALVRRVHGRRVREMAELARWIDQPWVLWGFLGHLDSDEIAEDVGHHTEECLRRAADVAVDLVLHFAQGELEVPAGSSEPLEVRPRGRYELQEVIVAKRWLLGREELPEAGERI
ncbi:MAG: hypothetical protein AB7N76_32930 [Planctomycetota bacterium]